MQASTPDWIDFHGLRAVRIAAPDGASAIVTAQGAHTVSWIPATGSERLYLSEHSAYLAGKAIRGGVPVIFPQFAELGPGARHGFARTFEWEFDAINRGKDFACVTFRLEHSDATRAIWPHAFHAELSVLVGGDRMDIELEVESRDANALSFTAALHTYLRVGDVETIRVEGLQGCKYRDATKGGREARERAEVLTVSDEVDRIYLDVPAALLLREPGRALALHSEGFRDVVVWNPWEEKCAQLADMPRDGFRRMLCIEAAAIAQPIELLPDETWWGRQTLVAM